MLRVPKVLYMCFIVLFISTFFITPGNASADEITDSINEAIEYYKEKTTLKLQTALTMLPNSYAKSEAASWKLFYRNR
jgi:hypothetical protein